MPERALDYQNLPNRSQSGFKIDAPSLERLYIDAALALTDQWVKLRNVEATEKFNISVESTSKEVLMLQWLNQVLLLFAEKKFLTKRIYFNRFNGIKIEATLIGEFYQPIRHGHIDSPAQLEATQIKLGLGDSGESLFFVQVTTSH